MKRATGGVCPKCGGTSFVGKRTATGLIAGGLAFAPQRLKCVSCGATLKSGSRWQAAQAAPTTKPEESRTKGGYVKRGGKVVVPKETMKLIEAWRTCGTADGTITGLTMADVVSRVGQEAEPLLPHQRFDWGDVYTWSRPGFSISVLFADGRAVRVVNDEVG